MQASTPKHIKVCSVQVGSICLSFSCAVNVPSALLYQSAILTYFIPASLHLSSWLSFYTRTVTATGGHWEKATEFFSKLQGQGCKPDSITFSALISAYERGGQWRRALKALEQMQVSCKDILSYTSHVESCSALICAYERGGQWRRALKALGRCR